MKPSEQGFFFQASQNESKEWYAMTKNYKNVNISVGYQWFCTKPSEQSSFFGAGSNESKEWYAMTGRCFTSDGNFSFLWYTVKLLLYGNLPFTA